jgi:hypothetical protein
MLRSSLRQQCCHLTLHIIPIPGPNPDVDNTEKHIRCEQRNHSRRAMFTSSRSVLERRD